MKISIISAVHNEELYVSEMILSVLRQDYEDWELLLVNDRSQDATQRIIEEHSREDARVRSLDATGVEGKNSAWNRGYQHANGALIVLLAGDDTLPEGSLTRRMDFMKGYVKSANFAVFSKVRMFSADPKFDGLVVPRGKRGSRSGGTTLLSRQLADEIFPICPSLPNEDLWISEIIKLRARTIYDVDCVTINYRVHDGNSFRRDRSFEQTANAIAERGRVYGRLLGESRFDWSLAEQEYLEARQNLEQQRAKGSVVGVLRAKGVPLKDRLRAIAYTNSGFFFLRRSFYGLFSGW